MLNLPVARWPEMRPFWPWAALRHFVAKCSPAISNHHRHVFSGSGMGNKSIKTYQYANVPGNAEWVEDYVVGGYHPVHLGDVFEKRYRIIRKLGNGRFATVWLAKDDRLGKYVALKVAVASNAAIGSEADILTELCLSPNKHHLPVPKLLDSFAVKGPNGVHDVLALEPLGRTLQQFIAEMQFRLRSDQEYHDVRVLRELSRRIIYAIHYIHSKGFVHRDIQPGNFMFALNNPLETTNEADLDEHTRLRCLQNIFPLQRLDGKPLTIHSPTYVVEPQPLEKKTIDMSSLSASRLVLNDFGAATTFENSNDGYHAYPATSRPPEVLLGLPVSEKSDIWALGCTVFHLVTLGDMFEVDSFKKGEEQDNEHLQSMIEVLGPMPKRMLGLWRGRHSVVDENGHLLEEHLEDPFSDLLDVQASERKPKSMSMKDALAFENFLRSIFQYEPEERPSAEELLRYHRLTEEIAHAKIF